MCCKNKWPCLDGVGCANKESVCDGNTDCFDKSDEHASVCKDWKCSKGRWKCNDFKCIDLLEVCDGKTHCNDTSDEHACVNWTCAAGWLKCNDRLQCIPQESVCDGTASCFDLSDEEDEYCMKYQCLPGFTKCANNLQCIKNLHICDEIYHCADISDEQCDSHCLREPQSGRKSIIRMCLEGPGNCVPVDQYCDGVANCPEASDEAKSDCSCEGWGLIGQTDAGIQFCLHSEWCSIQNGLNCTTLQCLVGPGQSLNANVTGQSNQYATDQSDNSPVYM